MKKFQLFIKIFSGIMIIFLIYNLIAWNFITKDLMSENDLNNSYANGDLSRLSYMPFYNIKKKNYIDLTKKHIELDEYKNQKIDVITFGDSFSNGLMGGKNPFYQDYIASYFDLNVLNINVLKFAEDEYLNNIIGFINSGILDKIHPKIIIIEAVERQAVQRYSINADLNQKFKYNNLESFKKFLYEKNIKPSNSLEFINNANVNILYNWILYKISDNAFSSQVYIKNANKNLFTKKNNKIMFYKEDLDFINLNSDEAKIKKVNNNLNLLAEKLAKKRIKLYFMPCVDKYNLYSKFIINNKYSQSQFFEKIRPLSKKYVFVDTKDILSKELNKGTKDIYYFDETHWSGKASEAIFKQVKLN